MVYGALIEQLPLECWLLFIANLSWTVAYDTQYAMVDRDDDLRIGVKSTAILLLNMTIRSSHYCNLSLFHCFDDYWLFIWINSGLFCRALLLHFLCYQSKLTKTRFREELFQSIFK